MKQPFWDRVGPVCGVLFALVMLGGWTVLGISADLAEYIAPNGTTDALARYVDGQRDTLSSAARVTGLAQILLVVFLADAHERLRRRVPSAARWLTTTFFAGGLIVAMAFVIQVFALIGVTQIADYGQDTQVANALNAFADSALDALMPGVVLMAGAAAVLSLRFGIFPRWLGRAALLPLLTLPFAWWLPIWVLWVLALSLLVLVRPSAVGHPGSPGNPSSAEAS